MCVAFTTFKIIKLDLSLVPICPCYSKEVIEQIRNESSSSTTKKKKKKKMKVGDNLVETQLEAHQVIFVMFIYFF